MLSIIVISPDGTQRHEAFDKASITVGRVADGTDLVLAGNAVSARHAVVGLRDGGWVLVDMGSTNGTWVNGQRITGPVKVGDDDVIQIGEFTLRLQGAANAVAEATARGAASTTAFEVSPAAGRALGISWSTAKQAVSDPAPHARQEADPGAWATMQAPSVDEASHGPASVRILAAPTASTRPAPMCMSCGASLAPDAVFCQACGAKRSDASDVRAAPAPADASMQYDATGAMAVPAPATGFEPTCAVAVASIASGNNATPAVAMSPSSIGTDATCAIAVTAEPAPKRAAEPPVPLAFDATGMMQAAGMTAAGARPPAPTSGAIVVDSSGAAGFRTIQEAIRVAQAGATIRVRPGVYVECLVVDKTVSLTADGGPVTVQAPTGSCLVSVAPAGLVQGMSFQGGKQTEPVVVLARGSLCLDRCEVVAPGGVALLVDGPESAPVVTACLVRHAAAEGIEIRNGARPRIDACEIAHTARAGICVHDGAAPVVTRCAVHDSLGQGLLVYGESAGIFDECEIASCRLAGIDVLSGSRPTVRRSRVRNSHEGCGVIVQYGGGGLFEDCMISGHRLSAVEVREAGQPWFRRCVLVESALERGLYVYDHGLGVFEDCELGRSRRHGVGIRSGAQPVLRRCRIHGSLEAGGIYVYRQGSGLFEDCEVVGNPGVGVELVEGGAASLRGCRVHGNAAGALRLVGNRDLYAADCELHGGPGRALQMEASARARFERCVFVGECVCGVDCTCETDGSTFRQG